MIIFFLIFNKIERVVIFVMWWFLFYLFFEKHVVIFIEYMWLFFFYKKKNYSLLILDS